MSSLDQLLLRADQLGTSRNSDVITPIASLPQYMTYEAFSEEIEGLEAKIEQTVSSAAELNPEKSKDSQSEDDDEDYENYLNELGFDTGELLKAIYFMEDSLSGRLDALTGTLGSYSEKALFIQQQAHSQLGVLSDTFKSLYELQYDELNKTLQRKPHDPKDDDPTEVILLDENGRRSKKIFDVDCSCSGGGGGFGLDDILPWGGKDKDKKNKPRGRKGIFGKMTDALKGGGGGKGKMLAVLAAAIGGTALYSATAGDDREDRYAGQPIDPSTATDAPVKVKLSEEDKKDITPDTPTPTDTNTTTTTFMSLLGLSDTSEQPTITQSNGQSGPIDFLNTSSLMPSAGGLMAMGMAIPGLSYGYDKIKGLVSSPAATNTAHIGGVPATLAQGRPPLPALPAPVLSTSTAVANLPDADFEDIPNDRKSVKAWKAAKGIGRGISKVGPLNIALGAADTYDIMTDDTKSTEEKGIALGGVAGGVGGGWAGATAGATAGAAGGALLGSVVPVIGTAIGGAIGGVVGGIAGSFGGYELGSFLGEEITASAWSWFSDDTSDKLKEQEAKRKQEKTTKDAERKAKIKEDQANSPYDINKEPWMFREDGSPIPVNRNARIEKKLYKVRKRNYESRNGEFVAPSATQIAINNVPEDNLVMADVKAEPEAEFTSSKSGGMYNFTKDIAENAVGKDVRSDYVNMTPADVEAKSQSEAIAELNAPAANIYKIEDEPWMFNSNGEQYRVNSNESLEKRHYAQRKRAWKVRSKIRGIPDAPASTHDEEVAATISANSSNADSISPKASVSSYMPDIADNTAEKVSASYKPTTSSGQTLSQKDVDMMADIRASTESWLPKEYVAKLKAQEAKSIQITKDVPSAIPLDSEKLNTNTGATERVESAVRDMATKVVPPRPLDAKKPMVVKNTSRPKPTLKDIPIIIDRGGLGLINLGYI